MPTFSIVINCYNYGRFVAAAIDSALAQDYPGNDVEIIVIDDGSTDDSPSVISKYGDRVRYFRQMNSGQAVAINRGVAESKGDIICLLDADDWFRPNKLSALAEYFMADPSVNAIYNRYDLVAGDGTLMAAGQPRILDGRHMRARALFGRAGGVPTSSISARRDLLSRIIIPRDFRICADTYLLVALALLGDIRVTPNALTAYRQHGDNAFLSHNNGARKKVLFDLNDNIASNIWNSFGIRLYDSLRRMREYPADGSYGAMRTIMNRGQREIASSTLPLTLKLAETAKLWLAAASALTRGRSLGVTE